VGVVIRVLIVNETRLIANVLSAVLEDEPDMRVVACATSGEAALSWAPQADVALVSTRLGDRDSVQLVRAMSGAVPYLKVLVLGLTESSAQVLQYAQAGAAGYVLKDDSVEDLVRRIRAACDDKALVSPEVAAALMARLAQLAHRVPETEASSDGRSDLTPRELEVLGLIAEGLTNQQIADHLVIEVGTVKNHVHSILQKLEVRSRQEAAELRRTSAELAGIP
jgi:two-component system nitrate/nitrite response regulator NarL